MLFRRTIEGGGHHFAVVERPLHVGHFLRSLIDQQNQKLNLGIVGLNGLGDVLHDRRFARFRRGNNQAALAFADGSEQVDDSRRHVERLILGFQHKTLIGEQWCQVLEVSTGFQLTWVLTVDGGDLAQRRVFLVPVGRTTGAGQMIALAQSELTDLLDRHIGVIAAGKETVGPQEGVAFVPEVDVAVDGDRFFAYSLIAGVVTVTTTALTPASVASVARLDIITLVVVPVAALVVGLVVVSVAALVVVPVVVPVVGLAIAP